MQDRTWQCESTWDPVLDTLAHGHSQPPLECSFFVTEIVFFLLDKECHLQFQEKQARPPGGLPGGLPVEEGCGA